MQLKEVIIGALYVSAEKHDLKNQLIDYGVQIKTARPAYKEFEITRQKDPKFQKEL
jgi:hypothetical protein